MITTFLVVAARGAAAPLNPSLDESAFASSLSKIRPRALILQRGLDSPARGAAERLAVPVIELLPAPDGMAGEFTLDGERLPPPVAAGLSGPHDVALILSTSGTTGRSQVVPLTHRNICSAAENTSAALGLTSSDRCLNVMPLFHGHGLIVGALASMIAGGGVMCTSGFDASMFFGRLDGYRPTWYTAVPAIHRAILAEAPRHPDIVARSRLRFIRSASAPLPLSVMTDLESTFTALVTEGYGLTEALQLTNTPLDARKRKPGSLGITGNSEVAIMDEADRILEPNQLGEIVCRGPVLMSGYDEDAEANRRSFVKGWFRTGDLGYLDPDGHLYMTGRAKEIINRGGEKVSPQEVDDVLLGCAQVLDAATFAMPHANLGEEIAVAVVLRSGAALREADIREFAARHLPAFKVPRKILIVDQIPKSPTGKVQRTHLAKKLGLLGPPRDPGRRAPFVAPRSPLEHQLAAIWEELFDLSPIGASDDFFDLGGDSLTGATLMTAIEAACHRVLPPAVLLEASTVARLASRILHEDDGFNEPLTGLRASGARTPLFFVHNDHGRGLYTYNLAHNLQTDRPVYAIHLHGLAERTLPATVEAIAADRIRAIRAVRPHGPYALGGHCNGGFVALEIAHQLRASGERVELVALVDTPAPSPTRRALHKAVSALAAWRRLPPAKGTELYLRLVTSYEPLVWWTAYYRDRLRVLATSGVTAQREFVLHHLAEVARHVTALLGLREASQPGAQHDPAAMARTEDAYRQAIRRYVPAPYAGPVVLFLAEELPANRTDLGWSRRLLPHLNVVVIPGDHHTCITRHVGAFAARLEEVMQNAETDQRIG
jgi:acyl-CoA synthetase (AMP-forming)/AMP-acid ligase II/thioesterase domain-containing protein